MRSTVLLAIVPLLLAAPAAAQFWSPPGNGPARSPVQFQVDPQPRTIDDARDAIRDGRRSGQLSPTDAKHLHREQRILSAIAERYAKDGLTPSEAADLDFRAHALLDRLEAARTSSSAKR